MQWLDDQLPGDRENNNGNDDTTECKDAGQFADADEQDQDQNGEIDFDEPQPGMWSAELPNIHVIRMLKLWQLALTWVAVSLMLTSI